MPALPPRQTIAQSNRTSTVLVAFCIGLAAGTLLTFCILQTLLNAVVLEENGISIVSASSCNVFQVSRGLLTTPGTVRYRVQFARVVDGDTIRVIWHGENLSVRLLGIDAPERGQLGGLESTQCLRELLAGADTVDLEFQEDAPRRDSLGRLLAYVWLGDSLLNLELVKRGHAGLYKGGGKGKYRDGLRHAAQSCGE